MKKFFVFLTIFFLVVLFASPIAFAAGESYTVLKTINEYSPVRVEPNIDAARFSHLKKGIELYAYDAVADFYKIDLGLEKPCFIEKKYVETEVSANSLKLRKAKSIVLKENREFFILKIKFDNPPPYQTCETFEGLDLNLFNTNVSSLKKIKTNKNFKIAKNNNVTTIKYVSKYPLVGYGVEKKGNSLILKIRKPLEIDSAMPLNGLTIVLDAGHGGSETGACANGFREKDINLQIVLKLKTALEEAGANVYLTRNDDSYMGLYERVDFAKDENAVILLSIHQNSLPNPKDYAKKHGVGVYYYNKQSKPLAAALQQGLLNATGFKDDGVNYASFALNRPTEMLSVLIECGYLIHPSEAKMLAGSEFQDKIAKSIVCALENYARSLSGTPCCN